MYGKEVFIVLIAVGVSSALIADIGKCKPGVTGLSSFDWKGFSTENGGKWSYKMVPQDFVATALWLESKDVGGGKYRATVYKQVGNAPATVNSDQIRQQVSGGHIVANAVSNPNKWDIYYLDYVPGSFASFYVCGDQGGKSSDAVFVVSNKPITPQIRAAVSTSVKDKGLNVVFRDL